MRILVTSTLYPPVVLGGYERECAMVVDRLRRDHEVLVAHITRTRELLAQPTAGPDDTRVLLALTGIAKLVDHHRRRGADLLYRVYSVDLSAGD